MSFLDKFTPFVAVTTAALFTASLSPVIAGIVWDEAVNGNLSNNRLTPTSVAVQLGSSTIKGSLTGTIAQGKYYDYATFTIPAGSALVRLTMDALTNGTSGTTIVGLAAGSTFPTTPGGMNANLMLGWTGVRPPGSTADLLPNLSVANNGGYGNSGFTIPLGAGTYTLWVQDYDTPAIYQLSLLLDPTVPPVIKVGKKSVKNERVSIKGTASGAGTTVSYRVGSKGKFKKVAITDAAWSFKAGLKSGKNIVTIQATGYFGKSTKKVTIEVDAE